MFILNMLYKYPVSAILLILFVAILTLNAQVKPVYDTGALGFGQALKRLQTTASVMMIGAHPDDEDSALLAYLARGENARTAYLSLTRGDGGQNIIGPELFESLGVIRTEELLQARRLDGAEQYFTRAYDYGFSKTLDEAKQKWPEKVILCDVVRAIRLFRPLVVISRFSGTPADGHGQHQYAGYITPLAVKAAADAQQCTESGSVWRVRKFYVEQGFGDNSQTNLRLNTGALDPILGRSYFEIAIEGRSQHRSQGEGRLELKGDQFSGLKLQSGGDNKKENSPFDGLDTSIKGIAPLTENSDAAFATKLSELQQKIETVAAAYRPFSPDDIVSGLADAYRTAKDAEAATQNPESKQFVSIVQAKLADAIRMAAGVQIDALADKETIAPGDEFAVSLKVYFPDNSRVKVNNANLISLGELKVTTAEAPKETGSGFFRREVGDFNTYYKVSVPTTAGLTRPYWLTEPRKGDMFSWPSDDRQNLPFGPAILKAEIAFDVDGVKVKLDRKVEYRFDDPARGEIRRELNIVPAVSVALGQKALIIPQTGKSETRQVVMTVTSNSAKPVNGMASLIVDSKSDWKVSPVSKVFEIKNKSEKTSVTFDVTAPANTKPGEYKILGVVTIDKANFDKEMHTIAYPHIQTHRFYMQAETDVTVLDLKVAPVKVGYVMGSGDEVPEAIRQMGLSVTMIDDLATADLSKFDVIVIGIRASEVRPDFAANNRKLLDYVQNGGALIVQYQRPTYVQQNLPPFPADMSDKQRTAAGSIARVVDENAKVTILQPTHPVFNFPNKISDNDFSGWIQERNLYNFVTFDPKYTPLLESHDQGEQENKGGMVYAEIGKGKFIYTSYSWFRQLPAGNPGAYRIFANMLSLGKKGK